MTSSTPPRHNKLLRALVASPLMFLAIACFKIMGLDSIGDYLKKDANTGRVEGALGNIPKIEKFYHIGFLDAMWKETSVAFAPSALGFDAVSSWQMFSFLIDLCPLYAIWLIESHRTTSVRTAAWLPSIFSFLAQFVSIGFIAPVYYFFYYVFNNPHISSPSFRSATQPALRTVLPLTLLFSTIPILLAYNHPSLETRHWWTWLWQMYPVWIGVSQVAATPLLSKPNGPDNRRVVRGTLFVLCTISSAVWISTIVLAPFPVREIFIPSGTPPTDFISALRRALQFDELLSVVASFVWLGYLFSDLESCPSLKWTRGSASSWIILITGGTALLVCYGPGTAIAVGWLWREEILTRQAGNSLKWKEG